MPTSTPRRTRSLGRRLVRWAAGLVAAGVLALGGSVAFVQARAYGHVYPEADVPATPVALVLGAQVYPDGTPSAFLRGRLDLAQRLYEAGRVQVILVSGDNMAVEYNEPDAMRDYLVAAGVPADKVVADYAGFDTYDSCVRATRIFGVTQATVVTQDYHLPRAVATCRAVGVAAVGVGDASARAYPRAWAYGAVRDQVATVKTVLDLLSGRDPVLGAQEDSVTHALQG